MYIFYLRPALERLPPIEPDERDGAELKLPAERPMLDEAERVGTLTFAERVGTLTFERVLDIVRGAALTLALALTLAFVLALTLAARDAVRASAATGFAMLVRVLVPALAFLAVRLALGSTLTFTLTLVLALASPTWKLRPAVGFVRFTLGLTFPAGPLSPGVAFQSAFT